MSIHPITIVGAGPGDPGLLTVRGRAVLGEADVVFYDHLVSPAVLAETRPGAELVYVGKEPGRHVVDEAAINRLLVEHARAGRRVCRLKGGDPMILGRGGETALALVREGIPFEIVPGVSSAYAVPAYAGIPVTHRGVSSSVAVVTGHEDPAKGDTAVDWEHLAKGVGTVVILMGVARLGEIASELVRHGRGASTPVAVIQWGTTPRQRTIIGTLADIARRVETAGMRPPCVVVVGEVVRLREELTWFERWSV